MGFFNAFKTEKKTKKLNIQQLADGSNALFYGAGRVLLGDLKVKVGKKTVYDLRKKFKKVKK